MVRTQIQLTEQQSKAVKTMSNVHGISTAEVIRRAINEELENLDNIETSHGRRIPLWLFGFM